jgi:uncharacterized protein (TIGR02757 family)
MLDLRTLSSIEAAEILDNLYDRLNKTCYISPDPLEVVRRYNSTEDMEIAGLIAGSLAVGRADLIVRASDKILSIMHDNTTGTSLPTFFEKKSVAEIVQMFETCKYRFYTGSDIAFFIITLGRLLQDYGSIANFVKSQLEVDYRIFFVAEKLYDFFNRNFLELTDGHVSMGLKHILPDPSKGSSLKRLNLFFRWMIRKDSVDLGCWDIDPSILIIPLDIHMLNLNKLMGVTARSSAGMKTALEITEYYRSINAKDPVKWDFSLTRLGIHPDFTYQDLIENKLKNREAY